MGYLNKKVQKGLRGAQRRPGGPKEGLKESGKKGRSFGSLCYFLRRYDSLQWTMTLSRHTAAFCRLKTVPARRVDCIWTFTRKTDRFFSRFAVVIEMVVRVVVI